MAGVSLHCLHIEELNCSSLSTWSARYWGQSIVEKPQKTAVAARWCSSLSGKGHHCISKCKWCKFGRPPPPKSPDLDIIENISDELYRCVRKTEANQTTLNQLKQKFSTSEWTPSELRSALFDVNGTSLSCQSKECGLTYPLLRLWYLLCFVIYSIKFGLF